MTTTIRAIRNASAAPFLAALVAAGCAGDPGEGKNSAVVGAPVSAGPTAAAAPAAETLAIAPAGSTIGFVGAKVSATHKGRFADFAGTISLVDGKPEASKVEVDVKMASLTMEGEPPDLVTHLKSKDFFEVETYPSGKFTSTSIVPGSTDPGMNYTVTGNLELRGTSKSVTFPANITVAPDAVTVKTEFAINRKDWGIVYPGMPDDLIKDNVLIQLDVKAPRPAPAEVGGGKPGL